MKYGKKRSAFLLAAVLMLTGLQMSGVTVKATAATPAVYTAEIKEDQTITAGQTVNLTVEMAAGTEKTYNSLNMVVSYDSNYLTFVKESSTGVAVCSFTETTSGVVDVARYGAAISLTTDKQVCKLVFKAKKAGTTTVSITSMKADIATHAALKDAPKVSVTTKDAVLTINPAPQKPSSGSGGSGGHHHKGGSSSDSGTSGPGAATPAENPTGVASAKTGDTAMPMLWVILIIAAVLGICLIGYKRRQYQDK